MSGACSPKSTPSVRSLTVALLACLGSVLVAGAAAAYVLPGTSILRRTANARDGMSSTSFRLTATLALSGEAAKLAAPALGLPDAPTLTVDATLTVKSPGRCRVEIPSTVGQPVVAVMSQTKRRFEGADVPALNAVVAEVCGLIATKAGSANDARAAIDKHLAALKVASRQSSLARFGGQVAYVLGETKKENAPQFWIYKESFQPARARFADTNGSNWDVRFLDYGAGPAGDGFPRIIEVQRNGQPEVKLTALSQDTRTSLNDRLF